MSKPPVEIRSIANREELEAVYDMLGNVFASERSFFQLRLDEDSTYDPSTTWVASVDERQMAGIYELFNMNRTYTVIRPDSFWDDQRKRPRWESSARLFACKDDLVVAYGQISEVKEEGVVHLEELCYRPGHEAAVIPLFLALARQRPQAERIHAKLPDDHKLVEAFTAWNAGHSTATYSMWQVIRFQPMLAKLASVFQQRLQDAGAADIERFALRLECNNQQAVLRYANEQFTVEPSDETANYDRSLALTQEQFIALLLQGVREKEWTDGSYESRIIRALFPKQLFQFYITDMF